MFSYLDVDCSPTCRWDVDIDNPPRQKEDWFLQNGSYQGAPSEEEYFLHRVPTQLTEPVYVRRRRQATALRQKLADNLEHPESVMGGTRNEAEARDGEEMALDLPPDIAADESKALEQHVSNANSGGRFTRRKK